MSRFAAKPGKFVDILDSDDEDGNRVTRPQVENNSADDRKLENRSFWKAGAFDIGPTKWTPSQGELEHARVHPKFLHSNATSHKWAFGAIAELLDNAVDEVNNGATFVNVDRIYSKRDNSPALLFLDDGGGMDPDGIRKCMSLGYSTKKSNNTIGQYGNGFKTSTMRLGADVIVFSRAYRNGRATQSVGLLSYTFLRRTGQDDVIVPMIDFDISKNWAEPILYGTQDDWSTNLKTILEWSPFTSKDDLIHQFEGIGPHGTKIIIYNLWLNDEGIYELNFDEDDEDIKLRDEGGVLSKKNQKAADLQAHISHRLLHSLRAYASVLYLRKFKNFKIILRGKPVEQFIIADDLKYQQVATYRPQVSSSKEPVAETTLGFIKEAPAIGVTGFNVYHKNRLIRPFWKVTSEGHSKGYGIVGVLEANFIEPAHDKQDFERSSLFSRLESKLRQMQMDYWKQHCHLIGHQPDKGFLRKMQQTNPVPLQTRDERFDQPVSGLAANPRPDLSGSQTGPPVRTVYNKETQMVRPPPGFQTGFDQEVTRGDTSRDIDEICDENIQLSMRCMQYVERENELKTTVGDLENQVAETKRKCAELSSRLELLRRQKPVKMGKKTISKRSKSRLGNDEDYKIRLTDNTISKVIEDMLTKEAIGSEKVTGQKVDVKKRKLDWSSSTSKQKAPKKIQRSFVKESIIQHPSIRTRTTPKSLLNTVHLLKEPQKEVIRNIGFGVLLDTKLEELSGTLGFYVVDNLDVDKLTIDTEQGPLEITPEVVHDMLGIPVGPVDFFSLPKREKNELFFSKWRSQFFSIKSLRPSNLAQALLNSSDPEFSLN